MPKVDSHPTRRQMLQAGVATAASVTVAGPALAAVGNPDAELSYLWRQYDGARAAAAMPPADPAVWLARAERAGLHLEADEDGGLFILFGQSDRGERILLDCWLQNTPGGQAAVVNLLNERTTRTAP